MKKVLLKFLKEKNVRKFNQFILLEKLLIYTGERNNFFISEDFLIKILKKYISNKNNLSKSSDFLDELSNFYETLIELYEKGQIGKFNFILKNYNISLNLREWLKSSRTEILNFFTFYEEKQMLKFLETIYNNDYFKVIKIKGQATKEFYTPYIDTQEIIIRIVLDGEIYYKEGVLLKKNEYIISNCMEFTAGWKILSNQLDMIIIAIKKEFFTRFKILKPTGIIHTKLSLSQEHLFDFFNKDYLVNHPFYLLEIITLFFQINQFLPKEIQSFSDILNSEISLITILEIINKNINKDYLEIRNILMSNLKLNKNKLEELIYKYETLTLRKFILKLKINNIINEYINTYLGLEELIFKYKIPNLEAFKYNLEKIYKLSLKDLKKQKLLQK